MKKKRSSIIKFAVVGVLLAVGLLFSFLKFPVANNDNFKSFAGTIKLGLDLEGGVYAVYEADDDGEGDLDSRMNATRTRLQNLLVSREYPEATVVRDGDRRLRVEVPAVDNTSELFRLIGEPSELKFVAADGSTVITGEHVLSATAGFDQQSAGYAVYLNLNSTGADLFSAATSSEHTGEVIKIILTTDGIDQTVSSPVINTQITNGQAIITGMDDLEYAQGVADQITSGLFEVRLSMIESAVVSATLGENALSRGLIAAIIAVILIIIFMCCFYRVLGVLASAALLIYIVLYLFFLAALPWVQLTLPGIAGILLSIGMAVDGNVIMFERIKSEFKNGKSIKASAFTGMKKSFAAIFDGNVTTIIAAIVLIIFGMGPIRSFGITLLVGIVLAMFTNLVVINWFVRWTLHINQSNAKAFGLKRGAAYKDLEADKTDVTIAAFEAEVEEEKQKNREKKKKKEVLEGGIV